ncbi:MAG: sulfite exporter TauE/SafE family protein [Nitrospirota bacterium]
MTPEEIGIIVLILITFVAAIVNGGLGYGFSSTAVPILLLFFLNRILNPAIVLLEIVINFYILILHWAQVRLIIKKVYPILISAIPGVLVGAWLLAFVDSAWIKMVTFSLLLPLILLQAGGIRMPIQSEKMAYTFLGAGVGFFYAVTTVSGPPLAVFLNNQGLVKKEFRAALGIIRLSLAIMTAASYYFLGLYQGESLNLLTTMVPSVLIGIPIGTYLIRKMDPETFRRVCMSFDVWFVGFGLSRVMIQLDILKSPYAYSVLVLAILIDIRLLYRYFTSAKSVSIPIGESLKNESGT